MASPTIIPVVEETTKCVGSTTVITLNEAFDIEVIVIGSSTSIRNSLRILFQIKRPASPGRGLIITFSIRKFSTGKLLKFIGESIVILEDVIAPIASLAAVTDPLAKSDVVIDPSKICSAALICLKLDEGICFP